MRVREMINALSSSHSLLNWNRFTCVLSHKHTGERDGESETQREGKAQQIEGESGMQVKVRVECANGGKYD